MRRLFLKIFTTIAIVLLALPHPLQPVAGSVPEQLFYDDGSREGFVVGLAGESSAVRFTPLKYPALISGAALHLFFVNDQCVDHEIWVLDDGGANGGPGNTLYGPIPFSVNSVLSWQEVSFPLLDDLEIVAGDFFIAYRKVKDSKSCAGIGLDVGPGSADRHWTHRQGEWEHELPLANAMIRAVVDYEGVGVETRTWSSIRLLLSESN